MKTPASTYLCLLTLTLSSSLAAQGDGARAYWKTLAGANAVTFWPISATGNFNPLNTAQVVIPNASFEADINLLGYTKVLPLFGRSTTASLLVPLGNLNANVSGVPLSQQDGASGMGDPMLQLNVNLFGAPAIMDLPSLMRYEPDFTLDLVLDLIIPIGEYSASQSLNLGQNRWSGRIGAPMMFALGPWVPGQRTTFELLPSVWLFDDNDNLGGLKLETDPIFSVEAHLTRDFTETFWGSLDVANFTGGKSTIGGAEGSSIDNLGVGVTLGFQASDNLSISMSYFATVDDQDPGDLRGDEFRIMFTYGWHPLIQNMNRLSGEN